MLSSWTHQGADNQGRDANKHAGIMVLCTYSHQTREIRAVKTYIGKLMVKELGELAQV